MQLRRFLAAAALVALSVVLPVIAHAENAAGANLNVVGPGRFAGFVEETLNSTVESIDRDSRRVVLKRAGGERVTVLADQRIRNFDRIQVGDKVVTRYTQALVLELRKGGAGIRERVDSKDREASADTEKPGSFTEKRITFVADVEKVDAHRQTVTLRGVTRTMQLRIKDPAQIGLIEKGDQVEGVYAEAVAIAVKRAKAKK